MRICGSLALAAVVAPASALLRVEMPWRQQGNARPALETWPKEALMKGAFRSFLQAMVSEVLEDAPDLHTEEALGFLGVDHLGSPPDSRQTSEELSSS